MKKGLIIFISIFFIVSCSELSMDTNVSKITQKRDWNKILITSTASCSLKLYTVASEDPSTEDWIMVEYGQQENSLNINFYDLDTEEPYWVSNGWTFNLSKIESWEVTYLIEQTSLWYIAIYSLFKDKGMLIMSKQYPLFWSVYWGQMIWYCN